MHGYMDHVITTVAAIGVLIASQSLIQRQTVDLANQTEQHSTATSLEDFTEVLEQDLRSIGSGVPTGNPMLAELNGDTFAFYGTADSSATANLIAYNRVLEDSSNGEPRFRIHRIVDGVLDGQSPLLSDYWFKLYTSDDAEVTGSDFSEVKRIRTRLEKPAPFYSSDPDEQLIQNVAWEAEIAPTNLDRYQTESESHPLLSLNVDFISY